MQLENFGNGVQTFTDFDQASGLIAAREGGVGGGTGLIHSQVAWDLNGNLSQRKDLKLSPSVTEDFFYDNLNRFEHSNRNGSMNLTVGLDAIGNLTSKTSVGNYNYTTAQASCSYYSHAQPRAVRKAGTTVYCYDANGNLVKRAGSTIGYTSYNLPSGINAGSNSSTLSYGAFRNRYRQVAVNAGATETTIYVAGLLEKVTDSQGTHYRHYIAGSQGTAAIHSRTVGGGNATYYAHQDHLGSPELFTSSSGGELVRPSFAAYGERRDGNDWLGLPTAGDLTAIGNVTRHGFTGHEHLDAVNLIHMNGRVYDPVAGRFLSRDPNVDGFASSQGSNGYAYVHNNPLTFIDPSGLVCRDDRGEHDGPNFPDLEVCGRRIQPSPPPPKLPPPPPHDGGGGDGGGTRGEPEQRKCATPAPKFTAMMQYGIFGQIKFKVLGIKVGFDINLMRLNDPLGEPIFWDQGIGIGASAFGRDFWFGFERVDPGGYGEGDWQWYGQIDSLTATNEGLAAGFEIGLLVGAEANVDNALALLPSGDTPCTH